jgi:phage tail tape-measure protein
MDMNPDPHQRDTQDEKDTAEKAVEQAGTHPLGAAVGAIGGAVAGAVAGIAAGPVGSLAGAVGGATLGAALGSGASATHATGPVTGPPGTGAEAAPEGDKPDAPTEDPLNRPTDSRP